MLGALSDALLIVAQVHILLFIFLGATVGYIVGMLPGLTGSVGMALLLPLTYGMSPYEAFALLGGVMGSSAFGGSIPAILMNTPGQPMNACTAFDGYPMAKQGKAKEALGAAAFSSLFGAIFGLVVLLLFIPILKPVVLLLGPPEWFLLAVFGLTLIAGISEGSMLSGLLAGALGLLLSFHGSNAVTGSVRYNFGTTYLMDGISFLPALMGLAMCLHRSIAVIGVITLFFMAVAFICPFELKKPESRGKIGMILFGCAELLILFMGARI